MPPDRVVIATMHGKEAVIAPLLQRALGLQPLLPAGFDTDRFGTFSRDIPRLDSPHATARAKIAAALECVPEAHAGVASEGSFGPHPQIPFVPIDSELVMLVDRRDGVEIVGTHVTPRTNYAQRVVVDARLAVAFAEGIGFPRHGVIVTAAVDGKSHPSLLLRKDNLSRAQLLANVADAIAISGAACVETDMRACRNPTRMRAIKRATIDLVRRYRSCCPQCGRRGFVPTERIAGLPCGSCHAPTDMIRGVVAICAGCGHRREQSFEAAWADPGRCDFCNP